MNPERKRNAVAKAYPGDAWKEKVSRMSDAQIHTLYMRLLNEGKLKGIQY